MCCLIPTTKYSSSVSIFIYSFPVLSSRDTQPSSPDPKTAWATLTAPVGPDEVGGLLRAPWFTGIHLVLHTEVAALQGLKDALNGEVVRPVICASIQIQQGSTGSPVEVPM